MPSWPIIGTLSTSIISGILAMEKHPTPKLPQGHSTSDISILLLSVSIIISYLEMSSGVTLGSNFVALKQLGLLLYSPSQLALGVCS
jgi:hypothetical protein